VNFEETVRGSQDSQEREVGCKPGFDGSGGIFALCFCFVFLHLKHSHVITPIIGGKCKSDVMA